MFRKELQVASRIRNAISPSCFAAPGPEISRIASGRRHVRHMDTRFKDRPLLAVIGCTGTGKTKLGVRLAKELDGEVVSADSIQVSGWRCFFFPVLAVTFHAASCVLSALRAARVERPKRPKREMPVDGENICTSRAPSPLASPFRPDTRYHVSVAASDRATRDGRQGLRGRRFARRAFARVSYSSDPSFGVTRVADARDR